MVSAEYLAGFFDGEGCVSASIEGRTNVTFVRLKITLSNTDSRVLLAIQSRFGGKLEQKRHSAKPKRRTIFELYWTTPHCRKVIEAMLPHVIIKRSQLELALRILDARDTSEKRRYTNSEDTRLARLIKALKQRTFDISGTAVEMPMELLNAPETLN